MGFCLSSDPIPALAEAEPYDLQMECMIIQRSNGKGSVNKTLYVSDLDGTLVWKKT